METDALNGTATLEREDEELKEPDEYRVLLLNDNFTTMEFVVSVLIAVFHKSVPEATRLMLEVHKKNRATVGVYGFDIATTKVSQVHQLAKQNGFPLKCTMEKA